MVKFIASDMDGTLLNENGQLHDEFYDVFQQLKENGIIFAAASGRQYYNLVNKFDAVKDDMMFIAENGTIVMHKGKELFSNCLQRDVAHEVIKIGRTIDDAFIVLCGKKSAYIESNDSRLVAEVEKYYAFYEIVEDLTAVEDDFLKVTMCDFAGAETNSHAHFAHYRERLQVAVAGYLWLDMTNKGANKGTAIASIQKQLGISFDDTMVFGDYLNDLEMMSSGYHSYAMENAHEDLKKVSRFQAKSNLENGVLEVIKGHLVTSV